MVNIISGRRMVGKVANRPPASYEFELVEGDSDQLTVKAPPSQISLWIDPTTIKLRHRIGRGPFGDVWLATHHQTTENYVEYREVAVKMLHPIREDHIKIVLDKFSDLFCKCQSLKGVCLLQGISIIGGKVSLLSGFTYNFNIFHPFLLNVMHVLPGVHCHEIL